MPEAFLVMLLIQFSTMVIDRALYLRKTVLGKLAFQVVLVLAVHLWMFFILPAVTERCVPGRRPRPDTGFVVPGGGRVVGVGTLTSDLASRSYPGCSARTRWPSCGTL